MSEFTSDLAANFSIRHDSDKYRYELLDGDELIGMASYHPDSDDKVWDFNSTHVDSKYGGQGLAAKLVTHALTDAKAAGHEIKATCSYVVQMLRKHPELG